MIDQLERAEEIYKNTIYTAQIEGERIGKIEGERIGKIEGERIGKIEGERIGVAKGKIEGERIGVAKGKIEGERIGKIEERFAVARNALQMGMSVADISKLTGLAESEIKKLMH